MTGTLSTLTDWHSSGTWTVTVFPGCLTSFRSSRSVGVWDKFCKQMAEDSLYRLLFCPCLESNDRHNAHNADLHHCIEEACVPQVAEPSHSDLLVVILCVGCIGTLCTPVGIFYHLRFFILLLVFRPMIILASLNYFTKKIKMFYTKTSTEGFGPNNRLW